MVKGGGWRQPFCRVEAAPKPAKRIRRGPVRQRTFVERAVVHEPIDPFADEFIEYDDVWAARPDITYVDALRRTRYACARPRSDGKASGGHREGIEKAWRARRADSVDVWGSIGVGMAIVSERSDAVFVVLFVFKRF